MALAQLIELILYFHIAGFHPVTIVFLLELLASLLHLMSFNIIFLFGEVFLDLLKVQNFRGLLRFVRHCLIEFLGHPSELFILALNKLSLDSTSLIIKLCHLPVPELVKFIELLKMCSLDFQLLIDMPGF